MKTGHKQTNRSPDVAVGSAIEVFAVFLKLGITSFGGPIAHLGYFHRELLERRRWLDEMQYAQVLALCQFLPGPASSQLGFSLGLLRAGWRGALCAFVAFTFPSALVMFVFATALPRIEHPLTHSAIHGLKLVAVAVVAQGLWLMAKRLTPDFGRVLVAAAAALLVTLSNSASTQVGIIIGGALLGLLLCRQVSSAPAEMFSLRYNARVGGILLAAFALLFAAALSVEQVRSPMLALAAAFYRAGALVFGGGHVVLPLLQQAVVEPEWVSNDDFLAGYGAAQAVPGPLFTIAAFLGARAAGPLGAVVGLAAIFLPGLLLISGALPFWQSIASRPASIHALAGVNAAVVGLLAAALYDPLWKTAICSPADIAITVVGFVMLAATRVSVLVVLAWCVGASVLCAAFQ